MSYYYCEFSHRFVKPTKLAVVSQLQPKCQLTHTRAAAYACSSNMQQARAHATAHSGLRNTCLHHHRHQQHLAPWNCRVETAKRALACAAMRSLQQCQQNDVLELTFTSSSSSSSGSSSSSSVEHVQVMQGWDGSSAVLLRKGQLLRLAAAAGEDAGALQLSALGGFPAADSLTVSSFPQLAGVLPAMHAHAGEVPAGTVTAKVVDSLEHLQQQVAADAAEWRDGNAPGDPVKTQLQQAVFTAGELEAFLQGQRGIALVQLFNGWEPSKGQPIYNPLAIHMLEQALAAPGVAFISSVAPGGVGLTGILYADREPFASWAMHLASFGCQANAVAGSAYYKLLIGQLLGYKLEHVLGYVASSGESASAQLQQQVAQDIRKLSNVKPQLPWSASDTNIRKHKPAAAAAAAAGAAAAGKGSAGFGGGKGGFAKKAAKR